MQNKKRRVAILFSVKNKPLILSAVLNTLCVKKENISEIVYFANLDSIPSLKDVLAESADRVTYCPLDGKSVISLSNGAVDAICTIGSKTKWVKKQEAILRNAGIQVPQFELDLNFAIEYARSMDKKLVSRITSLIELLSREVDLKDLTPLLIGDSKDIPKVVTKALQKEVKLKVLDISMESCLEEALLSLIDEGSLSQISMLKAIMSIQEKADVTSFLNELINRIICRERCTDFALKNNISIDEVELHLKYELYLFLKNNIICHLKRNRYSFSDVWASIVKDLNPLSQFNPKLKTDFLTKTIEN